MIRSHDWTTQTTRSRVVATLCAAMCSLISIWPMIFAQNMSGRGAWDDLQYHWVAIQQFADQFPSVDLSDYASATTPGYHLVLSIFVMWGAGHLAIQLIASLWTVALIALLGWIVSKRFGAMAVLLVLPLVLSMYMLYPGIWLLPDNAGWLAVVFVLWCSLPPSSSERTAIFLARFWIRLSIASVLLVMLVLVRQVHIWAASAIWVSAWIGTLNHNERDQSVFKPDIEAGALGLFLPIHLLPERFGRTLIAGGLTIPAFSVLILFISTWGGLVPPTFQDQHQGPNLVTPAFILTQISIVSVFFIPIMWGALKHLWAHHFITLLMIFVVGCVLGVISASSFSVEAGRYSGWWGLVHKLPVIMDRSPVIVLGSVGGALASAAWISLLCRRDAWIVLVSALAFVAAQTANHASWQRYHEPMILILLLLVLARASYRPASERSIWVGSFLLSLMLGCFTVLTMLNAKPYSEMKGSVRSSDSGLIVSETVRVAEFSTQNDLLAH